VGPAPSTPITQPTPTPPSGFTVDQLSPYYGSVRISSFLRSWFGGTYEVDLYADYSAKSGIDITNWRVRGNSGEIMIPQAVKKYPPYGFPLDADIVVVAGEYVKLFNGSSPIARNLGLNKCIGYMNNIYTFTPSLPNSCPAIDRSEVSTFTGRCQSFIFSLYGCRQPTANELNLFTGYNDEACHTYLERINYRGCYERHAGDSDFFSREWWIWTGGTFPFDRDHDRLLLFDRNGLLVNEYTY
jgi:hypothetical protein